MQNLAPALVKAQAAFAPAIKSATNPHFRNKYADLASVIGAVIDALNNNNIALMQQTKVCDDGVVVSTVFVHSSGETLNAGDLHVPAPKHDPQGYGSALTYARRYSLMAACGIAPEDDDGNAASRTREPGEDTPTQAPIPPEALAAAKRGTEAFRKWWKDAQKEMRDKSKPFIDDLQAEAAKADL